MNSLFAVTDEAESTSLLTIEELRAAAGVTGSSQDTALTLLGLRLSASISAQCCVASDGVNVPTLLSETCSDQYRPAKYETSLILSRRPVTSIVSVTENDIVLDAADYEVNPSSGVLKRLCGDSEAKWPCGKITVSYVAGYATAPDDLKLAASKLATALYTETARDPNLKRVNVPGVIEREYWVSPTDDPLLSREISDLISPYRQRWM